jgi:hypothetical protein
MKFTDDQYLGFDKLSKWYQRGERQFITVSGVVGTGVWELIQEFINHSELDQREVMYLSYDQKEVLELAFRSYHAYYTDSVIYRYIRVVDIDSMPIINPQSTATKVQWKKEKRSKVDSKYKLIVILDAGLLTKRVISDLSELGLPVILLTDPMLIPVLNGYTFARDPNILLSDINETIGSPPLNHFALMSIFGNRPKYGNYDNVTVVSMKQLNLYNLKSSDMNITMTDELRHEINMAYRDKVRNQRNDINTVGERLIAVTNLYGEKLVNRDNKKVKLYLRRGLVGTINRINKHQPVARYVPCDFKPDGYFDTFDGLYLDRYYLNYLNPIDSKQAHPENPFECEYAYALSSPLSRINHWDKVTVIVEDMADDQELHARLLYTAITRARVSLTLVI